MRQDDHRAVDSDALTTQDEHMDERRAVDSDGLQTAEE